MDCKILLADNSVTVQKIITLTFSDEGVDVIAVNNGYDAINRLRRLRPALVMVDIAISGRNGYEICEYVKTHPEMGDTPVILLVPAFEPLDEERARRAGADYHLAKPFQSIRMLISVVKNLIDRKETAELPSASDRLAAAQDGYKARYNTAQLNSRKARIDDLIRLSGLPTSEASDNDVEHDILLKGNPLGGNPLGDNGHYSDPPPIETPLEVEKKEDINMDNILELDDVLPEQPPLQVAGQLARHVGRQIETDAFVDNAETLPTVVPYETQEHAVVTHTAIDEIVNRVAAKLSEELVEKLSDEIARRVATEVTEMVRKQIFLETGSLLDSDNLRDSENLLDID